MSRSSDLDLEQFESLCLQESNLSVQKPPPKLQPFRHLHVGADVALKSCKTSTTHYLQPSATVASIPFKWQINARPTVVLLENFVNETISNYLTVDSSNSIHMRSSPSYRALFVRSYSLETKETTFQLNGTKLYLACDNDGKVILSEVVDAKAKWLTSYHNQYCFFKNSFSRKYLFGDLDGRCVGTSVSPATRFHWKINSLLAASIFYTDKTGAHYLTANKDGSISVNSAPSVGSTWLQVTRDNNFDMFAFQSCYGFWLDSNGTVATQSSKDCFPGKLANSSVWKFVP